MTINMKATKGFVAPAALTNAGIGANVSAR